MTPDLTPAADRALTLAPAYALAAGAASVEPLHLLHALLIEEEGRAFALLTKAGVDPDRHRAAAPTPATLPANPLPITASLRRVLSLARELAPEVSGEQTVAGEALLFALVRSDREVLAFLVPLGFDANRLEEELAAQRGPPLTLEEPLRLSDVAEQVDLARILDAAGNRAREGLRVAEDYCRFVLEDAFLTGQMKDLRHDLRAALAELPDSLLLSARETLRDVGTELSTEAEERRGSVLEAAQAGLKRAQEALRSLEEFGKVHGPRLGRALEALRYRTYTVERAVVLGTTARQRLAEARLYVLLTAATCQRGLRDTITAAAAGGADVIQLREKDLGDRDLLARARDVRQWTRAAGVLFIVNDRVDIARLVEADGVHLGQDDLPVKEARRLLGPDALVGVSTHDLAQLRQAVRDGASYVGVGPVFPSGTKQFSALAGLDYVRIVATETTLPAFALGGIDLRTVNEVVAAGARRIAVSGAVARAEDPQAVTAALRRALP
jgi:thiamine-phosphate pyrophosphorylase